MKHFKYLWYTDTHLDKVAPWTLARYIRHIVKENPAGLFLTGDISTGPLLCYHLKLMARFIKCPIYFILGNHDYHFTSFSKQHEKIRSLCKEYPNLIWLTESDTVSLNQEVALIGIEGRYDVRIGNPKYLKATFDWMLIEDFRKLSSMEERIDAFRELAKQSSDILERKLETALEKGFKKIHIMTHVPPWKEATRDEGTFLEKYYLPYNVNLCLGQMVERVMLERKKRNVVILAGHTHCDSWIHVSKNIECKVNQAKYFGSLRNEEIIYI